MLETCIRSRLLLRLHLAVTQMIGIVARKDTTIDTAEEVTIRIGEAITRIIR